MPERNNTAPVEKLLQMQQVFKTKLPEKLSEIESLWRLICDETSPNFTDLHLKLHSLVGSAGTFGASMVSSAARRMEAQIKLLLNKELNLDDGIREQIEYLLLDVRETTEKWQPSSIPFLPQVRDVDVEPEFDWQSKIYLVEDDIDVANDIIQFLEKSGYQVFYYENIKEFEDEYKSHERASAVIMDMSFKEGIIAGAETIQLLSKQDKNFPPVLFVSVHDDIQARLAAAQAGAKRYFTKPVDKLKLLNSLDNLTHKIKDKAYRILIVDDEKEVLDYYSTALQNDGMEVSSFVSPLDGYRSIEQFEPELIVLDLYMSECSGFDLAKVIRQDDKYSSIPIVFLSSELDVSTQLAAMYLGGDDFLIKPVDIEYFVQAINSRVKRARSINVLNNEINDALRESEFRLITLDNHAIISMTDTSGTITFVNQRFINISGFSEEELIGENHRILKSGKHSVSFYEEMWGTLLRGEIWSGQICNRTKNGEEYWVESTIVPFMDENGLPYKYVSVRTEITQVKQSEEGAKESEKRLLVQQDTLNTLSTITDYILLEEEAFFSIVTQRAVETLNVSRVSIWMFDEKKKIITCKKLFDKRDDAWSSEFVLKKDDYPEYFSALESNVIISAFDAHTHPATSEFSQGYLTPLGIDAMLDIPIRKQGLVIGVICCEHVGGSRNWCSDEKNFVVGLADLVTLNIESSERKRVEKELSEAKEIADNANKAKSEFLSSMSHELRTPMNAISGFAQLLLMGANNNFDEVQKDNIKEIINASDHLLALINEVLNLAQIESGKVDLSIVNVNCFEVMLESIALMNTMINKQNINLYFEFNGERISIEDELPSNIFVQVDKMRLKQILLNLLSNAVKYNKKGGSITLACNVLYDTVQVSVVDTGKGISNKEDVFKSFNRLGEEGGNIEGSGIGLVITKKLVELMSGKIGFDSEEGVGSTFWIEFPFVNSPNEEQVENDKDSIEVMLDDNIKHKVLYVEDNPANLRLIEQVLSSKDNVEMISAHEPNLGLELAKSELPDLILLDINLPGMSGYEVLKILRGDSVTKDIPVFAVSANAMIVDIEKGLNAGFDDYITKPIDVASFIIAVTKELKN